MVNGHGVRLVPLTEASIHGHQGRRASQYSGTEVTIDGEPLLILPESDVLAVLD
jgi:co-chaperonin GroES (HSP10)